MKFEDNFTDFDDNFTESDLNFTIPEVNLTGDLDFDMPDIKLPKEPKFPQGVKLPKISEVKLPKL